MTEWSPGTAPTTTYEQEAGMLPSGAGVEDNISNLVERAETAATNAETAETNAETAETNAETAQTAAETAKTGAETAQTAAEAAQTAAATSATNASTSATAAASSATTASTSETNAGNSATAAATSESNAATSATAASSAQTAAESARDATLAAYDNFDDRYLGAKASDPALDNDGNALIGGALYFNTTTEDMKIYTGSAWIVAYANLSTSNTDDLAEGSTNLYYTDARANSAIDTRVNKAFVDALNVDADTLDGVDSTGFATSAQGALADSALQAETNDLTAAVTWANVPDANITQSSVTQHQAALSIANTQVTGLGTAATTASTDYATAAQGALADTATQPGDLGTAAALDVGTGANNVVQLNGSGALPAVDGSNLTNVSSVANLNDLTDVDTTGVADGETIVYNSGTSSWEPGQAGGNSTTFGLFEHANTITVNYSITSGNNAIAAGPVDIDSGVTVTIPTGSRWVIV